MKHLKSIPQFTVILALLIGSLEPIIIKFAYQYQVAQYNLLVIRFLASSLIILPFFIFKKNKFLDRHEIKNLLPVAILFSITNIFLYLSLSFLTAVTVITFITTTPAFVAIINQKRKVDQLGKTFWPGFLMIFIGILLTISALSQEFKLVSFWGILTIILTVLCSTLYRVRLDTITKKFGSFQTSQYIFLINGIFSLFFIPFIHFKSHAQTVTTLGFGLLLGFTAIMANVAFLWAIKIFGSTKISIWGTLQRPIAIILSCVVLSEPLFFDQVIGIILVIFGVQLAKVRPHHHDLSKDRYNN